MILKFLFLAASLIPLTTSFPERTRWSNQPINFTSGTNAFLHAVLANDTEVRVKISCSQKEDSQKEDSKKEAPFVFEVRWLIRYSPCGGIYHMIQPEDAYQLLQHPDSLFQNEEYSEIMAPGLSETNSYIQPKLITCGQPVLLDGPSEQKPLRVPKLDSKENKNDAKQDENLNLAEHDMKEVDKNVAPVDIKDEDKDVAPVPAEKPANRDKRDARIVNQHVVYRTKECGPYLLVLQIKAVNVTQAIVEKAHGYYEVEFVSPHGYLSALDYPMLSFTTVLCVVYSLFCLLWMAFGALHWKDLLRVQYWIGAVIGMGLIEQAVFLAEYERMNSTGVVYQWAEMTAEFVSIVKRTLARCLVLIVSLGYGLVKPRLGSLMNNVVAVCLCYFVFAVLEAGLRIFQRRNDPSTKALIAAIPLSVTESIICWWVFTSLMATLKNLRLRRNIVKLTVYRHFFNTLIFCVVAAVVFMLWSIRMHKMPNCVKDWQELWIDDAYWQLLFCVILFVIIILWRPSQNNKRYAFSPLMDHEDDDQEEPFIEQENENFDHVKIRKNVSGVNYDKNLARTVDKSEDEHLKWVEENIPTSGFDTALPSLLDSDEEVMTTKLEMSKQQ